MSIKDDFNKFVSQEAINEREIRLMKISSKWMAERLCLDEYITKESIVQRIHQLAKELDL